MTKRVPENYRAGDLGGLLARIAELEAEVKRLRVAPSSVHVPAPNLLRAVALPVFMAVCAFGMLRTGPSIPLTIVVTTVVVLAGILLPIPSRSRVRAAALEPSQAERRAQVEARVIRDEAVVSPEVQRLVSVLRARAAQVPSREDESRS